MDGGVSHMAGKRRSRAVQGCPGLPESDAWVQSYTGEKGGGFWPILGLRAGFRVQGEGYVISRHADHTTRFLSSRAVQPCLGLPGSGAWMKSCALVHFGASPRGERSGVAAGLFLMLYEPNQSMHAHPVTLKPGGDLYLV